MFTIMIACSGGSQWVSLEKDLPELAGESRSFQFPDGRSQRRLVSRDKAYIKFKVLTLRTFNYGLKLLVIDVPCADDVRNGLRVSVFAHDCALKKTQQIHCDLNLVFSQQNWIRNYEEILLISSVGVVRFD